MSSREHMWYCHECHAEMRPLMVPHPVCASCQGSFVETMENPNDDPRAFTHEANAHVNDTETNEMPDISPLILGIQNLMDRGMTSNTSQPQRPPQNSSSFTFQISNHNGVRAVRFNSDAHPGDEENNLIPGTHIHNIPNMSTFIHSGPQTGNDGHISGARMAQYLMAMLGNHDLGGMIFGMPGNGRLGDYAFNQEALDQIITQIMENSNSNRAVPATDEIINNLPREVLLEKSPTLEKDCAVCKEQFKLETEDPDEQIVVTLPCKHPFHEPCILPWLKSSGTCPVCRHALVPQPEHSSTPPRSGSGPEGGGSGAPNRNPSPSQAGPSRVFQDFFNFSGFNGLSNSNSNNSSNDRGTRSRNHDSRSSSVPRPTSARRRSDLPRESDNSEHLPGSWAEGLE